MFMFLRSSVSSELSSGTAGCGGLLMADGGSLRVELVLGGRVSRVLLKGFTSVVENSNSKFKSTSGYKSNTLCIRPRLPLKNQSDWDLWHKFTFGSINSIPG